MAGGGAGAVGWKVATKGACIAVGSTTGVLSTVIVAPVAPSSTVVAPVAETDWVPPGWRVPVQRLVPVATVVTFTQHGALAEIRTVKAFLPTP